MVFTYFSPQWFRGTDIILEFSFFIFSLIIALFSYRIYKETSSRSVKYFGIGFLFISISNFIQTILNFIILYKLNNDSVYMMVDMMDYTQITQFEVLGLFSHMIFMTIGLSFLVYTTLKERGLKSLILILFLSLSGIIMSSNSLYLFYMFSTIFLGFILWHFVVNYINNKKIETFLVAIAFLFLFFGSFHFIISVNHQLFYAIGHILEFFSYVFILINLSIIRKK